jgi:hypothetical protein
MLIVADTWTMFYVADTWLDPDNPLNCILSDEEGEPLTFNTVEEAKKSEAYNDAQRPAVIQFVLH